jgi:cellulose synthase/poly-beta-1,6-N-acetylglucosamine synthase-like glycosyltransferase
MLSIKDQIMSELVNKRLSVMIGIPAYNEAGNIGGLISALLKQKQDSFKLERILVVSDASEDETDKIVKRFKDQRVRLIRNKQRLGQAETQNRIIKACKSDVLVLMNADVLPKGDKFLIQLIKAFKNDHQVGLVGAKVVPLEAANWFESVVNFSHEIKTEMVEQIRDGDTIHLCHGRGRAMSRELYQGLRFIPVVGEDAYNYLACKAAGLKFVYQPEAMVRYRSPSNLADHSRQSVRAMQSRKRHRELFAEIDVNKE